MTCNSELHEELPGDDLLTRHDEQLGHLAQARHLVEVHLAGGPADRPARAALTGAPLDVEFPRIGAARGADPGRASALLRVAATSQDEAAAGCAFSGALVELALASYPGLYATAPASLLDQLP